MFFVLESTNLYLCKDQKGRLLKNQYYLYPFFSGLYIFYLMEVVVALFRSKSGIHGHSHSSYQLEETNEIPKNVIVPYC